MNNCTVIGFQYSLDLRLDFRLSKSDLYVVYNYFNFPPLNYQIAFMLLPVSAYVCHVLWKNLFRNIPQNTEILLSRYCEFIELLFKNGKHQHCKHQHLILSTTFFNKKLRRPFYKQASVIRNFKISLHGSSAA